MWAGCRHAQLPYNPVFPYALLEINSLTLLCVSVGSEIVDPTHMAGTKTLPPL